MPSNVPHALGDSVFPHPHGDSDSTDALAHVKEIQAKAKQDLVVKAAVSKKTGPAINVGEEFEVTFTVSSKSKEYFWETAQLYMFPKEGVVKHVPANYYPYVHSYGGGSLLVAELPPFGQYFTREEYKLVSAVSTGLVVVKFKALVTVDPLSKKEYCKAYAIATRGRIPIGGESLLTPFVEWISSHVKHCPTCHAEWPDSYTYCPNDQTLLT